MRCLGLVACIAGCNVAPPPPLIPMHTDTAASPRGETTVMVVVGFATQVFNDGLGLALRVEHQQTDRTTLGLELAGGRGDGDEKTLYMLAIRGYGRGTPRSRDWVALTYGIGFSALNTGMLTLSAHGGAAVSHPNQYLEPYLHIGFAGALPIRKGTPFADLEGESSGPTLWTKTPDPPRDWNKRRKLRPTLYLYGDTGLVLPIGDEGNQLSLALSGAMGLFGAPGFAAITAADAVPL